MRLLNLLQWTGGLILTLSFALMACGGSSDAPADSGAPRDDIDADGAVPPAALVLPSELTFSTVHAGNFDSRTIVVANVGERPLTVTALTLSGPDAAAFSILDAASNGPPAFPSVIAVAESHAWLVRYAPRRPGEFAAQLTVETSAGDTPIDVTATADALPPQPSCTITSPVAIDFGRVAIGDRAQDLITIEGCPERVLVVTGLIVPGGLPKDVTLSPFEDGPPLPTSDAPLYVEPDDVVRFTLDYAPSPPDGLAEATISGEVLVAIQGRPVPDVVPFVGASYIAPGTPKAICAEMSPTGCALAIGSIEEGPEVTPLTTLHLHSDASCSPTGKIVARYWSVEQPDGSLQVFSKSAGDVNPTFSANVVGTYTFRLRVTDDQGKQGCGEWAAVVHVVPKAALHVELTWRTPSDPNETDVGATAGTDLDLHFVHLKYAVGSGFDGDGDGHDDPWFHQPYDAFWYNAHPNWGSFDPTANDDPSIDLDDTDGAGPEVLTLGVPQNGVSYEVGVHYWSDHGFGPTVATVRVYRFGVLAGTYEQTLDHLDMWCVARIDWPSGTVSPCALDLGAESVTPGYQNPYFIPN